MDWVFGGEVGDSDKDSEELRRSWGGRARKGIRRHMGLGGGMETKKLEMRLGRDGVWWEKGNTENEVGEGWSLVGEREHRE